MAEIYEDAWFSREAPFIVELHDAEKLSVVVRPNLNAAALVLDCIKSSIASRSAICSWNYAWRERRSPDSSSWSRQVWHGKSAAFGIANSLRVATVRDGLRTYEAFTFVAAYNRIIEADQTQFVCANQQYYLCATTIQSPGLQPTGKSF